MQINELHIKKTIIKFRLFLLKHFKNKKIQTLIWGLISYEMLSYVFWGIGTAIIDYVVFSSLTALGMQALISNVFSTFAAVIFAYVTNKIWVFKSKIKGFIAVLEEFMKFSSARMATLIMTEVILLVSQLLKGNPYYTKLVAMVLTVITNYILSKLFIFNKGKVTKNETVKN